MTQHSENQFDDLTAGMEDESVNLFEFGGDDESPIAQLKTIILSIDWEINDDILKQLNDELLDLNDIWADDKIKKVYIQGLDKIGKYIYKERANAHPDAIKVLLQFYHSLEKQVNLEDTMSTEEKKQLLMQDVKRFDQLKVNIAKAGPSETSAAPAAPATAAVEEESSSDEEKDNPLKILQAQVLGIDWEINDQELQKLSDEVKRLEGVIGQSKAKLILLQGIGAIGSYINKKRSQSDQSAFPLLHSFYDSLEKITLSDLPADEEKRILLTEVEKFNFFKKKISAEGASAVSAAASPSSKITPDEPAPAFAGGDQESDYNEDDAKVASDVESRLDSVFGDEGDEEPVGLNSDESALAGVDVETEADDDSDEEALPLEDGAVAPALVDAAEESSFSVDSLADQLVEGIAAEAPDEETEEAPIPGVDVETEADDDSDEDALPTDEGGLAPALFDSDEDSGFNEDQVAGEAESGEGDLENRLDSFFDDEIESSDEEAAVAADQASEEEFAAGLSFLDDEDEPAPAFADSDEAPAFEEETVEEGVADSLSFLDDDEPAPAFADSDEAPAAEEETVEEGVADSLSFLDDDEPAPAFADSDEAPAAEEETVEEGVADSLSFLDDDEPAPAFADSDEAPAAEEETVEEGVADSLSFLDDDEPAPTLAESDETPAADSLSFLDEEESEAAPEELAEEETEVEEPEEPATEEVAADETAEEIAEEAEGSEDVEVQDTAQEADDIDTVADDDETIDFTVPGEVAAAAAGVSAAAVSAVGEEDEEPEDVESVVFEVMPDDAEVDPLPDAAGELKTLLDCISALQEEVNDSNITSLFAAINMSRTSVSAGTADKIFLQLLSTICQKIEKKGSDSSDALINVLGILQEGMEACRNAPPSEAILKYILEGTAQVLIVLQKE